VWQEKRPLPADRASGVPHFPFRQELFIPPTITIEEMTGFSLFALKAVLSGRGDEIVDLAKVNFLQRWFS
jgi:hypothetical protein